MDIRLASRVRSRVSLSTSICPGGQREQLRPTTQHRFRAVRVAMVTVVDHAPGPVIGPATRPVRAMGNFFAMTLDTFVCMFKSPFAWREYLSQCWFVARVSTLPGVLMTIPWAVISGFLFNVLLTDIGAADFSGTGCAIFTVDQSAPIVTVLVVAGAGATAMCADLGARTIREELDALRVMGINPIQALAVPRVLAATTVSLALSSVVIATGLVGAFLCSVFLMHVSAGAWVTGLTTLTHTVDVIISMIKATLFGLMAGLIACYKGMSVGGGPAGVGRAVNETVVFAFIVLFVINIVVTAVGVPFMVS
ncbi:putative phospholipid ABC transporter permease protein MlaE [Mycobacterium basiliense]|uniref:Putative phospholipid ABC transporter permease protein MlaE n=2 Tax=Mycobacterium basiliense TaxID=2094119 RepID=A0A447GF53_9MYCO|nr:putative phospholipid ABC transporter permease protein MlaE [Mycobacterium basiliense]